MADGPVAAWLLVAGVGARRGVSEPQRLGHFIGQALDGSRKAAIPDAHELSVPVLSGQPELHIDQGVGRRLENHLNAAMSRDILFPERGSGEPLRKKSSLPASDHCGSRPPSAEICRLPDSSPSDRTYTSKRPDSFDRYASQRPSGETCACSSSAGVCGSARALPKS